MRSNDEEVVKRKTVSLKNRLPSAEDDEGRTAGALGQQLRGGVEGGTGAERSGDGVGDEDLLCGAGGVGAGDGGDVVHHVGIVIFGDEAEAHFRDAVAACEPAAEGLALKRLDRHHPDVVRPGLERFAHAGDGACAAHADHDAVHKAPALPRDGFGDGGAGDAAVVFGVVVVGEPVHIVPAVLRSLAFGQRPRTGQTVPGRGVQNLGTEAEQILLPQGRGILRHGDHDGVPGGAAAMSGVTAGALAACNAASSSTAASSGAVGSYTPGTYTGTAEGISSTVKVTMTFSDSAVTDVVVDTSGETASYGAAAAEELKNQLLNAGSDEIDGVSGSTITSDAVKKAAKSCFAQAKGEATVTSVQLPTGDETDWLGKEPDIDEAAITETVDTDILIVGAGNGGMFAAAYAAAKGLNFRVIEQNGNVQDTRHWVGAVDGFGAQEQGIKMDRAKLLSEVSRYASGKCDQRVVKTWINESAEMIEFVRSIMEDKYGVKMIYTYGDKAKWPAENAEHNTDYMYPEIEYTYDRSSGAARNELLLQYIQELGYDVDFKTSLAKLEKNSDGRITGIIAQSTEDDHFIRYNANKGVLLACGGFPGNPYMMEQLDPLGTSVTTACSYSPSDKGYGIRAAMWAGANLDKEAAPMLFDRGIVAPGVDGGYVDSDTAFGGKAFPGTIRQYNPGTQPFLKVNRNGERFANESSPYNDIVYAAAHQPGRVYAQICDANILEDAKRFHTIGCSAQTRNGGEKYIQGKMDEAIEAGALFKCDTLDELADKMGFTGAAKDTFLATVERYNELYDKQNDEDFGKPAYRLSAIRTAPFYGCWLGASLLTTEQGIAINEKGQALDNDNKPMPGLYITGDMSGSFFANNYPCLMAGVAMGRTLTFAMKAVKQMAGLE